MTATHQKINLNNCSHEQIFKAINLNNCSHEQIFKAISKIQAKAASTFVKDERRIGHHMKHMTDLAEHYVATSTGNFGMTKEGSSGGDGWRINHVAWNHSRAP